ncbi:hypothetical protein QJS65_10835 [Bacillus altitudinis]|uniref:hypothetical protein n=1 Tax=Bacillus altitudinis TaxID=293387 RepID=UPI0024A84742|nr:hypothetical protein [Bacillus altitudinis]WHF25345.1 hypothetical protein QJS65_10835 [Bacillus altitudinis]
MDRTKQEAFNELVTSICKQCREHRFTLKELEGIPSLIKDFYYSNSTPYRDKAN